MIVNERHLAAVIAAARQVPPTESSYLIEDFVSNLLLSVIDFEMHATVVERAVEYYEDNVYDRVRTMADLQTLIAEYSNDKAGNAALARRLWGNSMSERAAMLRGLVDFFDHVGVRNQVTFKRWASRAEFKRDFEGRVEGLGAAVFQWLIIRQGVAAMRPDAHLRRFCERTVGWRLADRDIIDLVACAADALGVEPSELAWAIWEQDRSNPTWRI